MSGFSVTRKLGPIDIGDHWLSIFTVTGDTSYTTGGYAASASTLGFQDTIDADIAPVDFNVWFGGSPDGFLPQYNYETGKVQFYASNATEVTSTTDTSGITDLDMYVIAKVRV